MWTDQTRPLYDRSKLRYPSDLTDQEWERLRPLFPPAKHGGRRRSVDEREIMNG
ncbi:IS5/IS1182 family transposase, partial [Streptomyces roseofulvus]